MLILFVLGHLAGNLLIILGPEAFNKYANKMISLRPGLYVVEYGLGLVFLIHIYFTTLIVYGNIKARDKNYTVQKNQGKRSLATRLMPWTGTFLIVFLICHLIDFTFSDHHGPLSYLPYGESLGLYGVVYTTFMDLQLSLFYVIAMCCLGLHLSHGISSFIQTFGFNHPRYTPIVMKIGAVIGFSIAVAYSSIPIYVFIDSQKYFH